MPGNSIDSLLYWMTVIREQLQSVFDELQKNNSEIIEIMKQRVGEKWEKNDDKNKINFMWMPVVVIGSKFDIFAKQYEPIKKKQLCLAMRHICHSNGCDLVFASVKEKLPAQMFKVMISRQVFDSGLQMKMERDPN
jgi:hypothetical protein